IKFNKKYIIYAALFILLLLGGYLRFHHADYPVIGYHNWKETHYLTEARNFNNDGFFKNGFFVPEWDYPSIGSDSTGVHADTFPTTSILVGLGFKIFGESLVVARMVGILCSLGSIFLMFKICKKMFGRDDIAFVSAGLMAISPLFVFFSRNVQLINPALLFMMLSWYFFLDCRKTFSLKSGILTTVFLMLAGLTKYPFLLIALPMLATIPWKKALTDVKANIKNYVIYIACMLPLPLWFVYSKIIEGRAGVTTVSGGLIEFEAIFRNAWWTAMKSYVADNYTLIGFGLAIAGLLLVYFFRKKHFGNKFILWYAAAAVPWIIVMGDKLGQHSYHQYPIAPLIIILMSYAIVAIGTNLAGIIGKGAVRDYAKIGILIVLVVLMLSPVGSLTAMNRQFDVQFFGLEVAGDYIKEHSSPEERILFPRGQSFGILWHADRKGYGINNPTLDQIKQAEEKGVTWIFAYQWGLQLMQNEEAVAYLSNTYSLEQVGFMNNGQEAQLAYLLFKKGGSFTQEELQQFPANHGIQTTPYDFSYGAVELSHSSKN
ncbi:MAG: glycosyltransferase family 39 protein, partial [Candidatus Undinarchaeales archaeon]|nr:glycosyltransferase family 39 protein [Candidatus Undinarchaeales archaeon]